ncbi:MAG: NAD-dependent malic enzyme [Acidobacteria bacterium]|nr:NAD-dependent malic enzyme [Acidobacteriota bacterium]
MSHFFKRQDDGTLRIEVAKRGKELLWDALLNKGTAFTEEERETFGLAGLLPAQVNTIDDQAERTYQAIIRKPEPLEQYIGLRALQDRNETLFYRLLIDHLEEFMPIVYTPTVGEAGFHFSQIFRRGRGIWITPEHRGRIKELLAGLGKPYVRLIVVTDNERILGLGDQGAGGMVIPIGKLALYAGCAGLHPSTTLPISIDVGTDNRHLLDDPQYVGYRQPRLRGEEYDALIDEFVQAVKECFPEVLLQWEDFKKVNAFDLLARYQDEILSFNDDIQGTAAVTTAGLVAACRVIGEKLSDQRIAILGGGAAGVGIAHQLRGAFEREGKSADEITRSIAVLDSRGLIHSGREGLDEHKKTFAWPHELATEHGLDPTEKIELEHMMGTMKPTMLIGTSGVPGTFTESALREMAKHVERPVVFPLSNPTAMSEAHAADVVEWTEGRALIATGSPFDPVKYDDRMIHVSQGNNVYIFPGVGLGALAARATKVTDSMFTAAAADLAEQVSPEDLEAGKLYPRLAEMRKITRSIGQAVARQVFEEGLAQADADTTIEDLIDELIWEPAYPTLVPV